MTRPTIVLDTGLLGELVHRRDDHRGPVLAWMLQQLGNGTEMAIPEICDYELRRELRRIGSEKSLKRLDELEATVTYLPITTSAMRRAAELWATLRREGQPTADPKALDGDVILCAIAQRYTEQSKRDIVVATTNVGHLSRMVAAKPRSAL